jgi:DNA-directed RNA polymerase subunit RPC12/RpoP
MRDQINSFFTKKSYVYAFLILPIFIPILGGYFGFKIYTNNPLSDAGSNIFTISMYIYIVCVLVQIQLDPNKHCAWCGSRKLQSLNTNTKSFYAHTNKDGSRDKRVKNNKLISYSTGEYKCNDCNAETHFASLISRVMLILKRTKVTTRNLIKDGNGPKTSKDL